ncbi:MAG: hypothetical protein ACYC0X_20215 [Pirellulaceae bacterium]
MLKPNLPTYYRTQKAPWFLLLWAFAALFFTIATVTRAEPVLPLILSMSGLLMAVLGFSFQHLTVADEGQWLAIRFGPLPFFKKRIRYEDIREVEVGRTMILDGWGIHMSLRGGWVWNIWGRDCVIIRQHRGVTRVGTDDPQGLAEFLKSRSIESSP